MLVMAEHQRAEVGGLAVELASPRVTEVYRKDGMERQLVHRHADPLVRDASPCNRRRYSPEVGLRENEGFLRVAGVAGSLRRSRIPKGRFSA